MDDNFNIGNIKLEKLNWHQIYFSFQKVIDELIRERFGDDLDIVLYTSRQLYLKTKDKGELIYIVTVEYDTKWTIEKIQKI